MCGIAGVVAPSAALLRPLPAMLAALRHRGPDDEGYVIVESGSRRARAHRGRDTVDGLRYPPFPAELPAGADLGLGHRRLAILDLSSAGHGPMPSADGHRWITYNGEIYNYLELREELKGLGHSFASATDTEVILAAWQEWGPECLPRFNGMWAFALYDGKRNVLFCARDRFGVKPLHYHAAGGLFAFASEIKGLLAHPAVPRRPRESALHAFLVAGALHEDAETFYGGIHTLAAGHHLTLDLPSRSLEIHRWYTLPDVPERPEAAREIGDLLADSVRLRLRSDVDVGTCLSGGLDSSSIVALSARLREGNRGRRSFSIVYADPGLDESVHIDTVVSATGVEPGRSTPTSADLLRDLPALVRHQDEPFPSASVYSQWRVMALAREARVPVLLDGQGADEVLAGYHYHYGPYLAGVAARRGVAAALREAARARRATGRPWSFFLGLLAYHSVPLPAAVRALAVRAQASQGRVPPELMTRELRAHGRASSERHQPRTDLRCELRAGLGSTSLPPLLRYEDRNSMAFSVEARTPFLDYRLVERAAALPDSELIHDGWTKAVLREAMKGIVPDSVRCRRDKLGFATPERRWLREIAPEVRAWLGSASRLRDRLDGDALRSWLAGSDTELSRRPGLWRLVSAELWLRGLESPRVA
ncbi:MAG: asparagine synthase (glutamine-hydrolyzing) [Acidobacteria bacterium]|nr:MAG: asparagine synthase (glutamine-hydrolyzing) [Acidobacteriota bacterium]